MKGLLFSKIDNKEELEIYHRMNPFVYIIQELVNYPLEVERILLRLPYEEKGHITGFIQKELMDVIGDGNNTLWELIMAHPNARLVTKRSKAMRWSVSVLRRFACCSCADQEKNRSDRHHDKHHGGRDHGLPARRPGHLARLFTHFLEKLERRCRHSNTVSIPSVVQQVQCSHDRHFAQASQVVDLTPHSSLAGVAGLEPATPGFGDRCSSR